MSLMNQLITDMTRSGYSASTSIKEYCEDTYETGRKWNTKRADGFSKTLHYILPFGGDYPYIEIQFITNHFGDEKIELYGKQSNGVDITIPPDLYQLLDIMNKDREDYDPIDLTSSFIINLLYALSKETNFKKIIEKLKSNGVTVIINQPMS